ncbi:ROK family protein [Paenibacillus thermotolerans]|uniref:ROK family protein n=1 Tax=Paenibacillus thermotolerans TaxID=3027807 RepID=UPI002368B9ED|nr:MULTISPECIES: ROK family protein [unclassified Paenibacillus]
MKSSVIGVDIGGTNIRVGRINDKLELVRKETALTERFRSAGELFAGIRRMIDDIDQGREADIIGMALPVPWRNDAERLVDVTNIPYLENASIQAIRSYFPEYDVYFENDVNVIAMLESERGAAHGVEHSMYISVSTGIGSGMIVGNAVFHGAHGYAGEIGSMFISDSGTLEELCSGKALTDEAIRLFGNEAKAQTLFERYHERDEQAIDVVELWVERFSRALASLMHTIDPDLFVLGGAVIDNNPWLIDKVTVNVKTKVFEHLRDKVRIARPAFGAEAGIIGAGYTAYKQSRRLRGKT